MQNLTVCEDDDRLPESDAEPLDSDAIPVQNPGSDGVTAALESNEKHGSINKAVEPEGSDAQRPTGRLVQWAFHGQGFVGTTRTVATLPVGTYKLDADQRVGWHLVPLPIVTDHLYRLPDTKSDEVIAEIQRFWELGDRFRELGFTHKRGILLWGPPGSGKCLGYNTPVMMADGSVKSVQDISVGDQLMGDDSKPRNVLSLARGREELFRVTPTKGDSYVVNRSHILSLKRHSTTAKLGIPKTEVVDISVNDWLQKSETFRQKWKGYRVGVDFRSQEVPLSPYLFGLWLGDGNSDRLTITTPDSEIVAYLREEIKKFPDLHLTVQGFKDNASSAYSFSSQNWKPGPRSADRNPALSALRALGVCDNKHIPNCYLRNSRESRLQLLAGLVDSDGHLANGVIDIIQKNRRLADDIVYLVRSLGLAAYLKPCEKYDQNGNGGEYFRICISGDLSEIPVKLARKKAAPRQQIKDVLVTGIECESLGEGNYYGFEIDGNHRFLLGDFTVTHNTSTLALATQQMLAMGGIVVFADHPGGIVSVLYQIRSVEPERPIIVILEDIDTIIKKHGESEVLSILDGEYSVDRIVFLATTNYPEQLDGRVVNRPSRFDKVVKIGTPNAEARRLYLLHKGVSAADVDRWVELSEGFSIAHLKEMMVGVMCFGDSLDAVAERLRKMTRVPKSGNTDNPMGFGVDAPSAHRSSGFGR